MRFLKIIAGCIRARLNLATTPKRRLKRNVGQKKLTILSGNADTPFWLKGWDDRNQEFYFSRHRSARQSLNSAYVLCQVILTRFKMRVCHGARYGQATSDNYGQRTSHLI